MIEDFERVERIENEIRICWLNRDTWEPGEVVVTLELQADLSVRATWHDENFRRWFAEGLAPAAMGNGGELVRVSTPELLYRYAAKVYGRSQTIVVIPDQHTVGMEILGRAPSHPGDRRSRLERPKAAPLSTALGKLGSGVGGRHRWRRRR